MTMQAIIPMLAYEDGIAALEWLVKAFGFTERKEMRMIDDNGRLSHGELELDNNMIMLATPTPDYESPARHRQHCEQARKWSAHRPLGLRSGRRGDTDTRRHRAFFISYEDPELTMLDSDKKIHREDLGLSHPWGLAVDAQRGIVYVTEIGKDTLVAYHEENSKTDTVSTGSMPDAVAIDGATNRIYVANYAADSVTVVDGATMKPVATVPVGTHPQALTVDGKRHIILVANTHSNSVTVIDRDNRVVATLPGGTNPYAVAVDSDTGNAYVANYGSNPVTKLDLTSIH